MTVRENVRLAIQAREAGRGKGMQGWMELPYNQGAIIEAIEKTAARVRTEFDAFVVLGIGGSALIGALAVGAVVVSALRAMDSLCCNSG